MIRYHGVPFSGGSEAWHPLSGKHAMVSFANPGQIELVAELCQSFVIDNGAFSKWSAGEGEVDLPAYKAFLDTWLSHPGCDWYVIPDSIDGDEGENDRLIAAWLSEAGGPMWRKGVPVWHLHESLDRLARMSRTYDRVALGSSGQYVDVGGFKWWHRMSEAMLAVCDNGIPRCKLHGLRMLDPTVFSHIPLASADSTNVGRNVGIDSRWSGPYAPRSKRMRALILMERIESHAVAARWCGTNGVQKNLELIG